MKLERSPVIIDGKPAVYAKGSAVTGAKGLVFLSGSVGEDINTGQVPEGAGEQAKLAMKNIKQRLQEYGSSLDHILLVRKYIKGIFPDGIVRHPMYQEISEAIEGFWAEHCPEFLRDNNPPASTLLGVTSLAQPHYLLEIEVVAAVD